jgi:hypothetical protein
MHTLSIVLTQPATVSEDMEVGSNASVTPHATAATQTTHKYPAAEVPT